MNKMSTLQISMGSEIKPMTDIKVQVLKRIVQVHGKLEEYNPLEDKNIPRVQDVFLCVDQTGPFTYMLNVVDQTQKTSYTRKEMTNVSDFQINMQEQGVNFIGNPRKNNYIPGYLFKVSTPAEFANVKRALATCMFEAQNKILHSKAEDFDEDFFAK
jgi:hypothetical protein